MLATRIDEGVTLDQVLHLMRSRGLDSLTQKNPQQATLQLVSLNHELRGDEFLYRRYRVLNR
jgi:preprotein translocase subunit Sec63